MLIAPELKLGRVIGLEVPLGVVGVSEGLHPDPAYMSSSGGSAYFAMPGARIHPFAGRFGGWGDAPWIAGGGGLTLTGGGVSPSVDVRVGADLALGRVAVGPFLGFLQIIDVHPSALRNDARLLVFGIHGHLPQRSPPARPGRALDSDHDGLPDSTDMCRSALLADGRCSDESPVPPPPTVAAAAVEEEDHVELDDRLSFRANSAAISPEGLLQLQRLTALLQQHPEYARLVILGHADEQGSDSYDMHLSEERANAVRAVLIRLGVEAGRLEVKFFGKTRPRERAHTLAAHAENRRIEFQIVRRRDPAPLAESTTPENERGLR